MKFKEELIHKHANQLKKNPTKHVNMTYINCEQDHIDNEIKHIFMNTMQWTTHIYQLRKGKDKHKNEIKYLLARMYPSMEEYFRNQRNFLWDLKYFLLTKRNS